MSLPSQSSVTHGRSYMYRRRRRRMPRARTVCVVLVLAAGGAWAIFESGVLEPDARETGKAPAGGALASNGRTLSPTQIVSPPRSLERAERQTRSPVSDAVGRTLSEQKAAGTGNGAHESGARPGASREGAASVPAVVPEGDGTAGEGANAPSTRPGNGSDTGRDAGRDTGRAAGMSTPGEGGVSAAFSRLYEEARMLESKGDSVSARATLNTALHLRDASERERQMARDAIMAINDRLVFSPNAAPGDPMTTTHTVAKGEFLSTIVKKHQLGVDWRVILDINRIPSAERIREGQTIKLLRGPFHAVVHKAAYRLDLYWGESQAPERWLFVRSFATGLGEDNSTPIGEFRVKNKLANPAWTNPRTGERFGADDPKNPIGEYWVGLEGVGESAVHVGYGLHGTIDPKSIGQDLSMGCVRMRDEDIRLVFSLLSERESVVKINP